MLDDVELADIHGQFNNFRPRRDFARRV